MRTLALLVFLAIPAEGITSDFQILPHIGHDNEVGAVVLLEKEGLVITGGDDRVVVIWSAQTGEILRRINTEERVCWLYHDPGTIHLWVGCMDRGGVYPPQCFDERTGAQLTGLRPPRGAEAEDSGFKDRTFEPRDITKSASPVEQAIWRKLEPMVVDEPSCYTISADDRFAVFGFSNGRAELWDVASPHLLQSFQTRSAFINGVACSGDGARLATWQYVAGSDNEPDLRLWELTNLQSHRCSLPSVRGIFSACMTRDGGVLYAVVSNYGSVDYRLLEINAVSGETIRQIGPANSHYLIARLSADDSLLAVSEFDQERNSHRVWVWERRAAPETARAYIAPEGLAAGAVATFFPDNRTLLAGSWERPGFCEMATNLWSMFTDKGIEKSGGRLERLRNLPKAKADEYAEVTGALVDMDVEPTGRWVAYGTEHRGIGGHEVVDLQARTRWVGDTPGLHHIRFRPGYPQLIVAGTHGEQIVEVRRRDTGAVIDSWKGGQHDDDRSAGTANNGWDGRRESMAITGNGNRIFLARTDGTVQVLDLDAQGKISVGIELVAVGKSDWVAVSPKGFYTGSPAGIDSIRLARGNVILPLSQLDAIFNRPDEIVATFGAPARTVAALRQLVDVRQAKAGSGNVDPSLPNGHRPSVSLVGFEPMPVCVNTSTYHLLVTATPAAAPLSCLRVVVNGTSWPSSDGIQFSDAELGHSQKMEIDVPLSHGVNRIHLLAVDAAGNESLQQVVQVERSGAAHRRVRLLAAGVTRYANPDLDLNFAASDARIVERIVSSWADSPNDFQSRVLADDDAKSGRIKEEAARLFESTEADDLVVLFLSGHGMLDPQDQSTWYFCPYDFDLANPRSRGLSFEQITRLFSGIGARQRLVLLDSCYSGELEIPAPALAQLQRSANRKGIMVLPRNYVARSLLPAAAGNEADAKGIGWTLQDLFSDFRANIGAAVIGASGALQFALEAQDLRQGVFTYSLAQGMTSGAADLDHDGKITASELHRYLADAVLQATDGEQRPSSRGINPDGDFVLAKNERSPTADDVAEFVASYFHMSSGGSSDLRTLRDMFDPMTDYLGRRCSREEIVATIHRHTKQGDSHYYHLTGIDSVLGTDRRTAVAKCRVEDHYVRRREGSAAHDDEGSVIQNWTIDAAWRANGWQITAVRAEAVAAPVTAKGERSASASPPPPPESVQDESDPFTLARESDRELNVVYNALRARLDVARKTQLKRSQIQWLATRSQQTGINEITTGKNFEASALRQFSRMNAARVVELQGILQSKQ